jgi:hypothetical protein
MKPRIILFALFASSIFSYAQAKERFVKNQNISSGSAEILLGTVKGQEQVVQMSGTRKIANRLRWGVGIFAYFGSSTSISPYPRSSAKIKTTFGLLLAYREQIEPSNKGKILDLRKLMLQEDYSAKF